jgi:serine/threonine protein kinase
MFPRVDGVEGPRTLSGGTMLDDKYRIESLLATGGMGTVYLGTHMRLHKRVAIKILNPQLTSAPMVERFRREAITASQIGHEGIAQVTDMGTSNDGEPFLVMEYLEGESLAARLKASGPLAIADACELGCSILEPLAAAHHAGIVHRDLKPDNVFLVRGSRGETVKLLDFGISRASGLDRQFRLTMTGLVLGTPYYMSPEQARGESEITPAADLYGFGVMLYEMLTGQVPIRADNYNQLMYRVTVGDFARPRELRPDLPDELERIILHAMAQTPDERPASAAELSQVLLGFCRPGFVAHANRASSPVILPRGSDDEIDQARFAGPTLSDSKPGSAGAGDTQRDLADDQVTLPRAGKPVLRIGRTLGALAIAVVGATAGCALVMLYAGGSGEELIAAAPPAEATPVIPALAAATDPAGEVTRPGGAGWIPTRPRATSLIEPATITLRLAVTPAEAAVVLDGAPVIGGEIVARRDNVRHRLQITAAGYNDFDQTLAFDDSQRVVVQLTRAAAAIRSNPARKSPRKDRPAPALLAVPLSPPVPAPSEGERIESKSPYR